MYVEGSDSSAIAGGVGVADTSASNKPCTGGSVDVADMTKQISEVLVVVPPTIYVSCTVISYDYIDSKHNMIEIHREIRKLPETERRSVAKKR